MKKSAKVTLSVVAAVGLASCGRGRRDPCQSEYFNEMACQDAVRDGGYYWGGTWYPTAYRYPYPYYYDGYRRHILSGGSVGAAPAGTYAKPPGKTFGTGGDTSSSGGTVRGGFGSTGAGGSSGE
jgi:hypothetical protein